MHIAVRYSIGSITNFPNYMLRLLNLFTGGLKNGIGFIADFFGKMLKRLHGLTGIRLHLAKIDMQIRQQSFVLMNLALLC